MTTKLILVVLRSGGCEKLNNRLLDEGYRVTEFASTGGFLRRGNTTLFIGVSDEQVEHVLALMREACTEMGEAAEGEHNATVFVLDARQFIHF
ncbi:MAG: hypothetical protein GXY36_11115 [Chloroflexi bacterium]|jgi:uncharacterized protein YaaQ|nr:hypothetical protein [Chloroflexota bacterium]